MTKGVILTYFLPKVKGIVAQFLSGGKLRGARLFTDAQNVGEPITGYWNTIAASHKMDID